MPQTMTSDMAKTILILKLCKEMPNTMRVYWLTTNIDCQIIFIEMLIYFRISKPKPILIKFEIGYKCIRKRYIS